MVAELEITFCQSNVNPLTSSHILKTRQNYIEGWKKLYIKNVVLNYFTPFIYINTNIPMERVIIRAQLKINRIGIVLRGQSPVPCSYLSDKGLKQGTAKRRAPNKDL